jgi:glucose-1-phosphatase
MQRTIATAEYFKAGFLPTCSDMRIHHRFAPSKMDPLFYPRLTKLSDEFKKQALKEINALGGEKGIVGLTESLKKSYELIEKITDMKNSPACKEDNTCTLDDYNTQVIFKLGEEVTMSGSLKLANTIADALFLQYYEVLDDKKAAFGNNLTLKDWENIAEVKDVFSAIVFGGAPIVAVNIAHPLLVYMKDELKSKDRKFTYLVGHDANITSVTNALQFDLSYLLPNTIEKKTPIGGKLAFEKWQDKKTKKEYIRINLIYQTTDQLRNLIPLNLDNPPASYPMKISGLTTNEFGLYDFDDVIKQFESAIAAYEDIK